MKMTKLAVLSLLFTGFALSNCQQAEPTVPATVQSEAAAKKNSIQRGEYLVNVLGCDDCHTPKTMTAQGPAPDMSRRFMGHPKDEPFPPKFDTKLITENHLAVMSPGMTAAAGPWGISFAANISPDDTGIGAWTEAQFFKAIREGKSKGLDGARPLLPPMPWFAYAKLTDEDLRAVFNFLKTVKPMENIVPQPKEL